MSFILHLAAARGIRVVPAKAGSEFKPVPYACDARPDFCGLCAVQECAYGQEPGLRGEASSPRHWRPKVKREKAKRERARRLRSEIDAIFGYPSLSDATDDWRRDLVFGGPGGDPWGSLDYPEWIFACPQCGSQLGGATEDAATRALGWHLYLVHGGDEPPRAA